MKRVRFESPSKSCFRSMDESECHSPRPFIERQAQAQAPDIYECNRVVYSSDPMHRFQYSDTSPYPLVKKCVVPTTYIGRPNHLPSNDLNLSMLDVHEPRPTFKYGENTIESREKLSLRPTVLSSIENTITPPNILQKDDSFFIRRDNMEKYNFHINSLHKEFNIMSLDKENDPLAKKSELGRVITDKVPLLPETVYSKPVVPNTTNSHCNCHHCNTSNSYLLCTAPVQKTSCENVMPEPTLTANMCHPHQPSNPSQPQIMSCYHHQQHIQQQQKTCFCSQNTPTIPQNAVDKKTWAIQRFEQINKSDCMEVEKQTNVVKEKREPTISDLLKIIKLQNEQLQLLQEKVDKFIMSSTKQQQQVPVQNYMTEHVALQTIDSEHKISIGVMTSFEMVRTSTVINKEILKQNDNAQIQCNRSQISIKEVVSKQPVNFNFLEGISPVSQPSELGSLTQENEAVLRNGTAQQIEKTNDDKTLNELSLYNVQVDNATTPQLSPEQSIYLDVRDYSDSDSISSDDQSNVGWTYYNKVMTHVNGMLQDSDMPSSASALFRNTRQQCVQMQFDKTNVSVTKRVKFGDDPLGLHQPHIYAASTDTSLKMNQLAAKYLKGAPAQSRVARPAANPVDMSFATRNYMERHKLVKGPPAPARPPPSNELPRFLDITALKQQPKLL